jgi:hypothetical protein
LSLPLSSWEWASTGLRYAKKKEFFLCNASTATATVRAREPYFPWFSAFKKSS